MIRPARAVIDLAAARHNLSRARALAPDARVMAVVKADAYGHGAARIATALDADAFGVARVHEGVALRECGVSRPIVVLSGASSRPAIEAAVGAGLDVVLHHETQLDAFRSARSSRPARAWLKIDTGMHRLGFEPAAARAAFARLEAPDTVLMTHLATADERRNPFTRTQLDNFTEGVAGLGSERSVANSAGVLGWPETHLDWVRPGIMLYGVSPFPWDDGAEQGLRAVMTLQTELIAVNHLRRGEAIGYGRTWVCPEDMPVGVAAIGYGDGYPRHAPAGTPVLVGGTRASLAGRVSMDLITLDLRECPQARPGDPVVLWGDGLPAEEVARHVGTIGYELVTRVSSRVERQHVGA